jgi:hypothetical protein
MSIIYHTTFRVDKKGFMKDRFMGENTCLLYDLMHYLEENDMDGLLISFQKNL